MKLAKAIQIREINDGSVELHWTQAFTSAPVDIFIGRTPDSIDTSAPRARSAERTALIKGLAPGVRHYYQLSPHGGQPVIMAQRDVPLPGSVNFRDLGGYTTADNRRVKWGRLYRSGHLSKLTARAQQTFAALDIRAVCDFRLSEERANEAMALPNNPTVDVLEIPPGVKDRYFFHRVFRESSDPHDVVQAVHDVVRSMVNESAPRYRRLFELLLEPTEQNILINCSAGKERTGVASALILTALGVPRETIYYDFMLSKIYFPAEGEIPRVLEKYEVGRVGDAARALVMPLLETRESYLKVAFDFIDENFGDGINFLQQHFDVGPPELARLRERYTC